MVFDYFQFIIVGDNECLVNLLITQYVNGYEQFILFARKEVEQDDELISIEFCYYGFSPSNLIRVTLFIS